MHELRHIAATAMIANASDDPDVRILRRVSTIQDFPLAPRGDGPLRRVALVDTETTGTNPEMDEVIDIAVVMLEVDAAGEIVGIASAGQALRDPGIPIPPLITKITGITDADVRGKAIDLDRLERLLASADVRLAHNAKFDIAFIEQLMPALAGAAWACSAGDFDWVGAAGLDGFKQAHLLMQIGFFNDTHRAMADVISLLHLVAHRLPHGGTVLGDLLANAEHPTVKFEATAAPYERRSQLKARGYRWDPRGKVWWCEIADHECAAEERWFREYISASGPVPRITEITWHQRHR